MNAIAQSARPGMLLGAYPERRWRSSESLLDAYFDVWRSGIQSRRLSMRRFSRELETIESYEKDCATIQPGPLRNLARRLGSQLVVEGMTREPALRLFAAICVAVTKTLGIRPHAEQLFAGWTILHGCVVEMQTGEGKTLTAAFPAIVMALAGIPVHVVTVNDYLVQRDAGQLAELYNFFGLSVGVVKAQMSDEERRQAYAMDIVYCSNKQLVFDYLRDRQILGEERVGLKSQLGSLLGLDRQQPVMRGLCFAIVDEADSVLVDDARTPLILAEPGATDRTPTAEAAVALSIARRLHEGADFRLAEDGRTVWLTDCGADALRSIASGLQGVWQFDRYRTELVHQALCALHILRLDRDYLVRDGKVQLISESTGRVLPDRKLRNGLHRFLEIKEKCELTQSDEPIAGLSFQRFFARYHHLSGMTGTASQVRNEVLRVYGLETVSVPPHCPDRRVHHETLVFSDRERQFEHLLADISTRHATGQPVLVGTRTVSLSETVSRLLEERGIQHELLNARQDEVEAKIISRAGRKGAVTVATNMAGRGTDIRLAEEALRRGGLHVMNLEVNESRRVDRQLFGRCARQGDPGSCQAILTLRDEAVAGAIPGRLLNTACRVSEFWPNAGQVLSRLFIRFAQWRSERRGASERMRVFKGLDRLSRQLAISGDME